MSTVLKMGAGLAGLGRLVLKPGTGTFGRVPQRKFSATGVKRERSKIMAIIIGPPGSGKGTISERIVRDFQLDHLSSGDMLRHHIMEQTKFGAKIAPIVNAGGLVGVELLAPMIEHEIKNCKSPSGWLLDGYPRTVQQATRLDLSFPPNLVIYLNVPFNTIIDRIKDRWVHIASGRVYNLLYNPPKAAGKDDVTGEALVQRHDDKPEAVGNRLKLYKDMVEPLLKYYKTVGLLEEFPGTESNIIYPQINDFLKNFQG